MDRAGLWQRARPYISRTGERVLPFGEVMDGRFQQFAGSTGVDDKRMNEQSDHF